VVNELYDFSGESVLKFLKGLDDEFTTVLLFGHNYAFTSLVNMMGDDYIENLPTSGMAILRFNETKWCKINEGKTLGITVPKALR